MEYDRSISRKEFFFQKQHSFTPACNLITLNLKHLLSWLAEREIPVCLCSHQQKLKEGRRRIQAHHDEFAQSVPVNCPASLNVHPVQGKVNLSQERRQVTDKRMRHIQYDSRLLTNHTASKEQSVYIRKPSNRLGHAILRSYVMLF